MISSVVKSFMNLNLFSIRTQSALLFVWLKNYQFPNVAPWAPGPVWFRVFEFFPWCFTLGPSPSQGLVNQWLVSK